MKRKQVVKKTAKVSVGIMGVFAGGVCIIIGLSMFGGRSLAESVTFLWRFAQQPQHVGAIAPSSQALAAALIRHFPDTRKRVLLEVGAGTGAVTDILITRLRDDDHLDVIEIDEELAEGLLQKYRHISNVHVHRCSIIEWNPQYHYDAIVSGIPFNAMQLKDVQEIFARYYDMIKICGVISYFSYAGLPHLKRVLLMGRDERKDFAGIQQFLKKQQKRYGFAHDLVYANLPPAEVFHLCIQKLQNSGAGS